MAIVRRWLTTWLLLVLSSLWFAGCAFIDNFDDFEVVADAGEAGTGGVGGVGGSGGVGGAGGTGGTGGTSGSGGTGGVGGNSGTGGTSGVGGTGGITDGGDLDAALDATVDAGEDAAVDAGEDAAVDAAIDLCASVTCPAMACKQAGVCNPLSGLCIYMNADDTTACASDNMPCTIDQCMGGVCAHTARDCSGMNGACVDGVCNQGTGVCEPVAKTNNTLCTDNNMCTQGDTCQGGTCVPGPQPNCTSFDGTCTVGACNPANGQCRSTNRSNNTPCDDTFTNVDGTFPNYCTANDHCSAGVCVSGTLQCGRNCAGPRCDDFYYCDDSVRANNCAPSYESDGSCDCGCQFSDDIDCGFAPICAGHWYGNTLCDMGWYDDGACDCGCQFDNGDPFYVADIDCLI